MGLRISCHKMDAILFRSWTFAGAKTIPHRARISRRREDQAHHHISNGEMRVAIGQTILHNRDAGRCRPDFISLPSEGEAVAALAKEPGITMPRCVCRREPLMQRT